MTVEAALSAHYRHGRLEAALLDALVAMGKNPEHLAPHDLMGADEFHTGGAQATQELAAQLGLHADMHLLDIGSGLGGPARHLAATYGCRVTGIDLTEEFVATATSLTRRMGMSEHVSFHHCSASDMPFAPGSFSGATLLHVGMNIADKPALFAAVHRALRPGGFFAIYDLMRVDAGQLDFPLPWSSAPETSFVATPDAYRAALAEAGFTLAHERDRGQFARDFFADQRARLAASGPPPFGIAPVMGPEAPKKIANLVQLLNRGVLAPIEMIGRR